MSCIVQESSGVLHKTATAQHRQPGRIERIRHNLVTAEARVRRIISLIVEMRAHGQDTQQAERLLHTHREFLALSREFLAREEIERQRAVIPQGNCQNGR
jgi:hypothetical protein